LYGVSMNEQNEKFNRCLFFLLGKPREKKELLTLYYDKEELSDYEFRSKSGSFDRDVLKPLMKMKIIKRERGKIILKETGKSKINRKFVMTDINWDVFVEWWKKEVITEMENLNPYMNEKFPIPEIEDKIREDIKLFLKDLEKVANFIKENRKVLFDINILKLLFYRNNKWYIPSVRGLINISLFYFYYSVIGRHNKGDRLVLNIRLLISTSYEEYTLKDLNLSYKELEEIEKKILDRLYKKLEKYLGSDISHIRDYFKFISIFYYKHYKKEHFEFISHFIEGLPVPLEIKKIKEMIEYYDSLPDNDPQKNTKYMDYNLPIPDGQKYLKPLKIMVELFK